MKVIVKVYLGGLICEAMFIQSVRPENEEVVHHLLAPSHVFDVGLPEADIWVCRFQLPKPFIRRALI